MHRAIRTALAVFGLAASAAAQGIYFDFPPPHPGPTPRPEPVDSRLVLVRTVLKGEVRDAAAEYRIEQVFRNPGDRTIEGTYLFPIPKSAVARGMSLTIDGREVAGEVLAAEQARGIYRDIVQRSRDPGLLEYVDQGLLRASVFPIAPRSEVRVVLQFAAVAERIGELAALTLPLKAATGGDAALLVDIELATTRPLTAVYSPSHQVDVQRPSDRSARVTLEGRQLRRADLLLYYAQNEGEVGMSLVAHRLPAQDGTFLAVIAPAARGTAARTPRDVVFVLDRSGSMAGVKWEQATKALEYGLKTLAPEDRFQLVSFATDVRLYKTGLVAASSEEVKGAIAHLTELRPAGGTNFAGALEQSLALLEKEPQRLSLVPFLTDGLPTIGEVDPSRIVDAAARANGGRARLFTFGVGEDVNTFLLDRMADDNRGASDYVAEGENLEVRVSAFFAKVAEPVLVQLQLSFSGVEVFDVYPQRLPDLFAGSAVMVAGRYKGSGRAAVTLTGRCTTGERSFTAELEFPAETRSAAFLPSLWAARKVGHLLNEIRLRGANRELIDSVIALGKEYGIVTPYTSALVVEEGMRLGRISGGVPLPPGGSARAGFATEKAEQEARDQLEGASLERKDDGPGVGGGAAPTAASGRAAVDVAKAVLHLREGDAGAENLRAQLGGASVERLNASGRSLVRVGATVIDTALTEELARDMTEIEAFSGAYFELLDRHPELSELLALGTDLAFVLDGKALRVKPPAP